MARAITLSLLILLSLCSSIIPVAGTTASTQTVNQANEAVPCEVSGSFNQSEKQCLIDTYSPVFHFHPDERYRPTSIAKFVAEARVGIRDKNVTLSDLATEDRDLEIDSEEYTYRDHDLPRVVYASVDPNAEFTPPTVSTSNEYVAVTYWTFYFHDDKAALRDKFGDDSITTVEPEEHQSDFESVTILINSSGPQWIGASQHLGGERRPWSEVSTLQETHPHLYVAEGAHSLYFTNSEQYGSRGIFGQEHHLDTDSHSTQVNQAWFSSIPPSLASNAGLVYTDLTGNYSTWVQAGSASADALSRETYRIEVLTGDEPWQNYGGSFVDSELSKQLIGDASPPAQRDRWNVSGDWMENRLVDSSTQVVPQVGWQFHGFNKGGFNDSTATIKVKIRNVGPQPGTLYTRLTVRNAHGPVIGLTVYEVQRQAGTNQLAGQETIYVDIDETPTSKINVTLEVFTTPPTSESSPKATLSGEICAGLPGCLV